MVLVNDSLNTIANIFAGSGVVISHTAIGTGSATISTTDTTLTNEVDRNQLFQPTNDILQLLTVQNNTVTAQSDFSSVEMSGVQLTEFGTFNNSVGGTGNMFNKENIGSIGFDGTIELQVINTFRFVSGT